MKLEILELIWSSHPEMIERKDRKEIQRVLPERKERKKISREFQIPFSLSPFYCFIYSAKMYRLALHKRTKKKDSRNQNTIATGAFALIYIYIYISMATHYPRNLLKSS